MSLAVAEEVGGGEAGEKKGVAIDMSWAKYSQGSPETTASRFAHTVTEARGQLILFGGINFERDFADALVAQVPPKETEPQKDGAAA